jgi:sarcosine oxidase subunit gamma
VSNLATIERYTPLDNIEAYKNARIEISERAFVGKITLRGNSDDPAFMKAVKKAIGLVPPTAACRFVEGDDVTIFWQGPDEWLIHTGVDQEGETLSKLQTALEGQHVQLVDISDYYTIIRLEGTVVRDVIAKGCPLDIHPREFAVGQCAGTVFAHATIFLAQMPSDQTCFDIQIRATYAPYLWHYLVDAAKEFA